MVLTKTSFTLNHKTSNCQIFSFRISFAIHGLINSEFLIDVGHFEAPYTVISNDYEIQHFFFSSIASLVSLRIFFALASIVC